MVKYEFLGERASVEENSHEEIRGTLTDKLVVKDLPLGAQAEGRVHGTWEESDEERP